MIHRKPRWKRSAPCWRESKGAARCPLECGVEWNQEAWSSMLACSPRTEPNPSERGARGHGSMLSSWGVQWARRFSTAARTVCFGSRGAALNTVRSRTLEGRRIVVTRAPAQTKDLRERLEELGAEVILLPLVRFLEPENTADLDRAIRSLEQFDWLIFTSANAVTFFLGRCRTLGYRPTVKAKKIAAVGSATRLALEKEGFEVSFVPAEFSGAGLAG